ncbi:SixA phosphatase family protein [Galbibacter sp.]|jgi:phosphohistidine phosphatase|uniref:SixA phosphatase family protein n=1 Tax=Galbibacter sp. TaxID=2918471 RepID=UPI003A92DEB3
MKEIILVRHAKSSWDVICPTEKERPLTQKGIKEAEKMSKYLSQKIKVPELIYSSSANRALETAMIFMRGLNVDPKVVRVSEELYCFPAEPIIEFIRNLDEDYDRVMIFGHNSGFTTISNTFGDRNIGGVPTSGVVQIIFDVSSWKQIDQGQTEIVAFPKLLY